MRYLLFLFLALGLSLSADAALASPVATPATEVAVSADALSRKAIEAKLGRRLTFKERIGLSIARSQAKRSERRAQRAAAGGRPVSGLALGSFAAGLLSILALITASSFGALLWLILIPTSIVLGIVALTQWKRHPERSGRGFAIAGIAIGGTWLVFIAVVIALIAASI